MNVAAEITFGVILVFGAITVMYWIVRGAKSARQQLREGGPMSVISTRRNPSIRRLLWGNQA